MPACLALIVSVKLTTGSASAIRPGQNWPRKLFCTLANLMKEIHEQVGVISEMNGKVFQVLLNWYKISLVLMPEIERKHLHAPFPQARNRYSVAVDMNNKKQR